MANLKRNMLELVENPEEVLSGGEPDLKKYWTPPFIPLSVVREAMQMEKDMDGETDQDEMQLFDRMIEFVAKRIYNDQFTVEDVYNKLHAPNAIQVIRDQITFITQGNQTDETKKFLEKKLS
ncbi:phage tail assembly chaperone G [Terribacillus saccharophilus]|uniref:phage tail assembly chaperone G n=1 Tax=Terribacillus saccharophilus TaxID=361277 RepID=UPI003982A199